MTPHRVTRRCIEKMAQVSRSEIERFNEEEPLSRWELLGTCAATTGAAATAARRELEEQPDWWLHYPGAGNVAILTWNNQVREIIRLSSERPTRPGSQEAEKGKTETED